MKLLYVIYNQNTGEIDGGTGWIEEGNAKHAEMINRILAKDPDRTVLYKPWADFAPDHRIHIVDAGEIRLKTSAEKKEDSDEFWWKKALDTHSRIMALDDLETGGKIGAAKAAKLRAILQAEFSAIVKDR